jgi:hypothetical protein
MKMKKPDSSPFFVLFGKHKPDSNEVVFGGNYRRERCERQMANPFAGVSAGTGRIVEFPSRKAAWAAHGDALNIAHGRVDFP